MAEKKRLRWVGNRWVPLAPVTKLSSYKSPEQIAGEVTKMIIDHQFTDVVMIGERSGKNGVAKCYRWMHDSKLLWFSKHLEFLSLHGRFPYDASDGGSI